MTNSVQSTNSFNESQAGTARDLVAALRCSHANTCIAAALRRAVNGAQR
jgi:hypothetical protein